MEFRYGAPVRESVMTLFLRPIQDRRQLLRDFSIHTDPGGKIFDFEGPFRNRGHFFNRPAAHRRLHIEARSVVEVAPPDPLPERLGPGSREALAGATRAPELRLMLQPSPFARSSPALERFIAAHRLAPGDDPLAAARELTAKLHGVFEYVPGSTAVDSPIERVLETGRGVCQDYAHVMVAVMRGWGVPSRYVSGYLGLAAGKVAHSESHAWAECWFPGVGWRGFDPTNGSECDECHVRVAVGRDYADVPPARGVFRGSTDSTLATRVAFERED